MQLQLEGLETQSEVLGGQLQPVSRDEKELPPPSDPRMHRDEWREGQGDSLATPNELHQCVAI